MGLPDKIIRPYFRLLPSKRNYGISQKIIKLIFEIVAQLLFIRSALHRGS